MNLSAQKTPQLLLGVPSQGTWDGAFAMCFVQLCLRLVTEGIPYTICHSTGSMLPTLRHNIVKRALEDKATHILWLDSDQTFPAYTAERLLAPGREIIGCNIATKQFPSTPTARRRSEDRFTGWPVRCRFAPECPPLDPEIWISPPEGNFQTPSCTLH